MAEPGAASPEDVAGAGKLVPTGVAAPFERVCLCIAVLGCSECEDHYAPITCHDKPFGPFAGTFGR